MKIQVMGPGCSKCDETEQNVRQAVAEAGIDAEVVKVTDFQEMAKYGIFTTPAVVINDNVKVVGKVPKKEDILDWLT